MSRTVSVKIYTMMIRFRITSSILVSSILIFFLNLPITKSTVWEYEERSDEIKDDAISEGYAISEDEYAVSDTEAYGNDGVTISDSYGQGRRGGVGKALAVSEEGISVAKGTGKSRTGPAVGIGQAVSQEGSAIGIGKSKSLYGVSESDAQAVSLGGGNANGISLAESEFGPALSNGQSISIEGDSRTHSTARSNYGDAISTGQTVSQFGNAEGNTLAISNKGNAVSDNTVEAINGGHAVGNSVAISNDGIAIAKDTSISNEGPAISKSTAIKGPYQTIPDTVPVTDREDRQPYEIHGETDIYSDYPAAVTDTLALSENGPAITDANAINLGNGPAISDGTAISSNDDAIVNSQSYSKGGPSIASGTAVVGGDNEIYGPTYENIPVFIDGDDQIYESDEEIDIYSDYPAAVTDTLALSENGPAITDANAINLGNGPAISDGTAISSNDDAIVNSQSYSKGGPSIASGTAVVGGDNVLYGPTYENVPVFIGGDDQIYEADEEIDIYSDYPAAVTDTTAFSENGPAITDANAINLGNGPAISDGTAISLNDDAIVNSQSYSKEGPSIASGTAVVGGDNELYGPTYENIPVFIDGDDQIYETDEEIDIYSDYPSAVTDTSAFSENGPAITDANAINLGNGPAVAHGTSISGDGDAIVNSLAYSDDGPAIASGLAVAGGNEFNDAEQINELDSDDFDHPAAISESVSVSDNGGAVSDSTAIHYGDGPAIALSVTVVNNSDESSESSSEEDEDVEEEEGIEEIVSGEVVDQIQEEVEKLLVDDELGVYSDVPVAISEVLAVSENGPAISDSNAVNLSGGPAISDSTAISGDDEAVVNSLAYSKDGPAISSGVAVVAGDGEPYEQVPNEVLPRTTSEQSEQPSEKFYGVNGCQINVRRLYDRNVPIDVVPFEACTYITVEYGVINDQCEFVLDEEFIEIDRTLGNLGLQKLMWLDINSFIYSTNAGVSMSEECQIHLVETIIENSRRLNYSGVEIAYIPNTTSEEEMIAYIRFIEYLSNVLHEENYVLYSWLPPAKHYLKDYPFKYMFPFVDFYILKTFNYLTGDVAVATTHLYPTECPVDGDAIEELVLMLIDYEVERRRIIVEISLTAVFWQQPSGTPASSEQPTFGSYYEIASVAETMQGVVASYVDVKEAIEIAFFCINNDLGGIHLNSIDQDLVQDGHNFPMTMALSNAMKNPIQIQNCCCQNYMDNKLIYKIEPGNCG